VDLLRLISIAVLAHMVFVAARMTASLYALANQASAFTVGVILALFSLVPMLISVRAGRWLDAVGPLRPTLIGTLLILGGALLPWMFSYEAADLAPLLVAATLIGTGLTLVADPARRPAAFSAFALGVSVSGFTGPVLSGVLIDTFGHRTTFGAMVVVALLALAMVWTSRDLMPSRHGDVKPPRPMHPVELFRNTELRHILIATALISMCWDLQSFVIPVYGTQVGLSASEIGFVLGSFALATFVIRLAMPVLARRFTEWQVLIYTMFSAALAFSLFPMFSSGAPMMAIAFLLGLGLGAAQPNIMSLVHSRSPQGRIGEVLGVRLTIIHANQVVLPLIFGAFGSVLGAAAMFWTMAVLVFSGGVGAVRWKMHKR
jgi:predicted MFS family arabinose efflux permease